MSEKALFLLPAEILQQHMIVLGKTGSGKSSALRYIVEHLLAMGKRVCIVDPKGDWWGIKSSADGKGAGYPVVAFGDFKEPKASDVPISEHSGKHVAELVATGNRPCVIGFRGWMTGRMTRFWIEFASTIFAQNAGELYLVGDEFHNFAPKGKIMDPQAGQCLHWSNRLLSEGRGLGIVCLLASQRPQKVHNDTLTSCETLVAMRVTHASDRRAVRDWIEGCGDEDQGKEVLNSLAQMARGEAYVWSPEAGFGPLKFKFPMFWTFDSFAPPQLQKKVNAEGWASVDLEAVKQKLAAVIEEQKSNDPAELKRTIAQLKKELHQAQKTQPLAAPKEVPVPMLSKDEFEILRSINASMDYAKDELANVKMLTTVLSGRLESRSVTQKPVARMVSKPVRNTNPPPSSAPGNSDISGGLRRMMIALAQRPGLTKKQLGIRAGLSSTSGTFGTYLGRLRSNGWVDGSDQLTLTVSGNQALGWYEPLPEGQDLLRFWLAELGQSGAGRMLSTLAEAYPEALTKEELGQRADISHTSGTFGTYLGKLRTLELVEGRGELRASREFFE